jgi:hypothetical protein
MLHFHPQRQYLTTAFDDVYIPNKSNAQVIEVMKERIPATKMAVTPKKTLKDKRKAAERPKRRQMM